jgi:DNA-binding winged helix-turn-helix (wHTH) protein
MCFRKDIESFIFYFKNDKMSTAKFIINERFKVDVDSNKILDKKNNVETKTEPRLIKLLCLLIDKQGEVVTREFLIKEIWDNYLGANEGLNQAISFLRKILDDSEKKMLRTVPKKGYSFHATLDDHSETKISKLHFPHLKRIAVAVFLLIFSINLFYAIRNMVFFKPGKAQSPDLESLKEKGQQDAKNKAILLYNMDSRAQAKKMAKNTLSQ